MRCKTDQREGSRSAKSPETFGDDPRVSSHHEARERFGRLGNEAR